MHLGQTDVIHVEKQLDVKDNPVIMISYLVPLFLIPLLTQKISTA